MMSVLSEHDLLLINDGCTVLAGVDEVGRGPLAGPVVAASVVIDGKWFAEGVNDSKKLSEKKRESIYESLMNSGCPIGVGIKSHEIIDQVNIRQATLLAMEEAIINTEATPHLLLIDGVEKLKLPFKQQSIVKGDAKSYCIAAASIIAKVTRDRMMKEYSLIYPQYGFEQNMGYPTKQHREAILEYGPCPIHRMTFLKKILKETGYEK